MGEFLYQDVQNPVKEEVEEGVISPMVAREYAATGLTA